MPARISTVTGLAEAERYVGAGAQPAATLPCAVAATLAALVEHLPPTATLHVALNESGEYVAATEDSGRLYPHGERFALREDGSIARGDIEQPVYFGNVREFLLSTEMSIEVVRQITESALDAFWQRVASLSPAIPGDMAPGETDYLERAALQTVAVWVTNNHPQFAGDENFEATDTLLEASRDPRAI